MTDDAGELETRFLSAVRESYAQYHAHGARSPKKLHSLHQWVADEITSILGSGYVAQSLRTSGESGEETIEGKYYDKKVDISIARKGGAPLAVVSVKFITSNFKQNANNYFEHLMGETANIRRAGVGFGHLMVLPAAIPYLKRGGDIATTEIIQDHHLKKYAKLGQDDNYPHKPDALAIVIISLPDNLQNAEEIKLKNLDEMEVSKVVKAALRKFSLPSFMAKMKAVVEAKELEQQDDC